MTMGIVFINIIAIATTLGMFEIFCEFAFLKDLSIKNLIKALISLSAATMCAFMSICLASIKL